MRGEVDKEMSIPKLTKEDVRQILTDFHIADIGDPKWGGQKIVFPIKIDDKWFAVKFMLVPPQHPVEDEGEQTKDLIDEVTSRAKREIEVMKVCVSPYLVKLGPIPLTPLNYKGELLLYFTEEFIEGEDLKKIIARKEKLSVETIIHLGRNITEAINVLWTCAKVHRDIKPGNIMRNSKADNFILLDLGLVFDLFDESLTTSGIIPGTPIYFSPDQIDLARKRQMDFRSDLFSLGIVLYEAATGKHPFIAGAKDNTGVIANILSHNPPPPSSIRNDLPAILDSIIMRLLAKKPHLRFRTCRQLDEALAVVSVR